MIGSTVRRALGLGQPATLDSYATAALAGVPRNPEWPRWSIDSGASAERLALIYRCVNLFAYFAGTAPLRVRNATTQNVIDTHPLRMLMRRPNPLMGETSFWSHIAVRSAIAGFAVCEKERDPRTDEVVALWPLQSAWLKARKRSDGRFDWEYRIPSTAEVFTLDAEDVVRFTWADTFTGSPYGIGPVEACFREIGLSDTMVDFLKAFFDNGAVPLYALIPDLLPGQRLTQQQVDDMTARFMYRHTGLRNSALPAMLQGIKDVKRLGFDLNELAYVDLRDLNELAIIQAFGIPATVAQIRVGLEHSDSRANAEVDEMKFYRQAIIPWWTRADDAIELQLLSDLGEPDLEDVYFDSSDISALQEDRNAKAPWIIQGFTSGLFSAHSAHDELGIERPKGPDYYLRSIGYEIVPVEDPMGAKLREEKQAMADAIASGQANKAIPANTGDQNANQNAALAAPERLALAANRMLDRYGSANKDRALIAKVADTHETAIKRFLDDQAKRLTPLVIDGMRTLRTPETYAVPIETLALEAVDWQAEDEALGKVLDRLYLTAGQASWRQMKLVHGVEPKTSWNLANPNVRRVMENLGTRVKGINETTQSVIQEIVTEAGEKGWTTRETADALRAKLVDLSPGRSRTIARTESMVSYGHANVEGFRDSGVVDRCQIFDNETHTEPYGASDGLTCAQRNGLVVELDKTMDHIYADHPNGSAVATPVLIGED